MIGLTTQNFLWVEKEPCSIWEARDPACAGEIVIEYKRLRESGSEPHRVSTFYIDEASQLGKYFQPHAEGGGMSDLLNDELFKFENAKLDGSCGEVIHKDINHIATRSAAASFKYLACYARLPQHLIMYDVAVNLNMTLKLEK